MDLLGRGRPRRGTRDAPLARVLSAEGVPLGVGFHSPRSQIRVRLVRAGDGQVDRASSASASPRRWRCAAASCRPDHRLSAAQRRGRRRAGLDGRPLRRRPGQPGHRRRPGGLRDEAYAALLELVPQAAVLQRNRGGMRRREGLTEEDELIAGARARGIRQPGSAGIARLPEARFTENGLAFTADLTGGQKTGFYCDQRDEPPARGDAGRRPTCSTSSPTAAPSGSTRCAAARAGGPRVGRALIERARRHPPTTRSTGRA